MGEHRPGDLGEKLLRELTLKGRPLAPQPPTDGVMGDTKVRRDRFDADGPGPRLERAFCGREDLVVRQSHPLAGLARDRWGWWRTTRPHFADDDLDLLRRRHEGKALQFPLNLDQHELHRLQLQDWLLLAPADLVMENRTSLRSSLKIPCSDA